MDAPTPLRIVFCGTPAFGLPSLKQLLSDSRFEIAAVVTQPDRPRGRGQEISASPVKTFALESNLKVFQPDRIGSESSREFFMNISPDAVVIIAYGQIVSPQLLEIPRLGWINLHASLLPKYRGAAPINWAIANGESVTGISTMLVDAGMDTGAVLLKHEIKIGPDETAPQLAARMAALGAPLVTNSLIGLNEKTLVPRLQDNSQATRAPLLKKEHGRINWNLPAQQIYNRVRGLAPWPGAFTNFRRQICHIWGKPASAGTNIESQTHAATPGTILSLAHHLFVCCGDNTHFEITELQLEGRKRISAVQFRSGAHLALNESFSSEAPASTKS
jgi:methionyl-tRNA formyltransferase